MKSRPTIFLSGASNEFGSFRDAVENEIQMKGCFAENQPGFPPDYRTVEEMLIRRLTDSDAVIHIVGFRFGAEPNQRPAGTSRRSYTQMEFDIARRLEKPIYVFISNDASVRDDAKPDEKPEDVEAQQIQLAHREAVQKTNYLHYFFKDKGELCKLVAEIPPLKAAGFRADISRIDRYAPADLIGREDETKFLTHAWAKVRKAESPRPHVIIFVALGGEGKTSLVAKWAADLAHENWAGCDAAFAWSFYSQGTREQTAASSDLFLKEALAFFGDPAMTDSAQGAFEKCRRLAQLVGERRALLILDGLEPLQYAPTSPTRGELKDPGIAALLKGLAAANQGLCVVTTRYSVPDLKAYWETNAPEVKLTRLSKEAGVALLRSLGVKGTQQEFETLVEDVKGHALTLQLLGTYIHDAHAGDIRKRDLVKLEDADEERGGHAFRVMDAYVRWFESEGEKGRRAIAVLRLLGLFDRPATGDCIAALLKAPAIVGLTEALAGMSEAQRNLAFTRLEAAKLLTANRDPAGTLLSLDAHPLLREYFARKLRAQHPEAWRAAHRRLYEHLCQTTTDKKPNPTLEDLQPLYQAVAHGYHAGLQQETFERVFFARIVRRHNAYSTWNLGAFSADLGAIACFFEQPWRDVSPSLTHEAQDFLLNHAGNCLRAVGRLTEALDPARASMEMSILLKHWKNAFVSASVLNSLTLSLGHVDMAVRDAERFVADADTRDDLYLQMYSRVPLAHALFQSGSGAEAERRFQEAEQIQRAGQPPYRFLYSLQGFHYCELLLSVSEHAAWQKMLSLNGSSSVAGDGVGLQACRNVEKRAAATLDWSINHLDMGPLPIALDHLTRGRTALYAALLDSSNSRLQSAVSETTAAMDGLREAREQDHISAGLLTRAWLRFLTGVHAGPESAQADLDEAREIAQRGPRKLLLTDIYLHRARLFYAVTPYPWEGSPRADLAAARELIEQCGYWRRKEELEDAEAAAKNW